MFQLCKGIYNFWKFAWKSSLASAWKRILISMKSSGKWHKDSFYPPKDECDVIILLHIIMTTSSIKLTSFDLDTFLNFMVFDTGEHSTVFVVL